MIFSSIPFVFVFIPIFLVIYRITPYKYKNGVILIFSLIFYAWGEPVYIALMIFETMSDYVIGRLMERSDKGGGRKLLLLTSLVVDLGILAFFKYANFLIGVLNSAVGTDISLLNLSLPVGISFFTFQSLSYVIDLYRKDITAEHNYLDYLTYISMFPQLVAGPIVRFATIRGELKNRDRNISFLSYDFTNGFMRFLTGLFKKVLLANQIGSMFDSIDVMSRTEASVITMWLGAIAFTFQIYFDFSGYSDMAIGMGRMLGFTFDENFNYPLVSDSITDFWRRWHISLSTFFRNYVYIPLGGNRVSVPRHIRNIMIVWMLTGLWHGCSWNFVLWGLYYGILLLLEKYFLGKFIRRLPVIFRIMYSFVLVCIGFVIFSHDDLSQMVSYLGGMIMLNGNSFFGTETLWLLSQNIIILILCFIFAAPLDLRLKSIIVKLRPALYLVLFVITTACLVNDSYNPFLYFRF